MNREERRALLHAHWCRIVTEQRSCDICSCDLDGDAYEGESVACAGMVCCRRCAIEAVTDTVARPTLEMRPIANDEARDNLRRGVTRDGMAVAS